MPGSAVWDEGSESFAKLFERNSTTVDTGWLTALLKVELKANCLAKSFALTFEVEISGEKEDSSNFCLTISSYFSLLKTLLESETALENQFGREDFQNCSECLYLHLYGFYSFFGKLWVLFKVALVPLWCAECRFPWIIYLTWEHISDESIHSKLSGLHENMQIWISSWQSHSSNWWEVTSSPKYHERIPQCMSANFLRRKKPCFCSFRRWSFGDWNTC